MRDWLLTEGGVAPSDLRMLVSAAPGTTLPDDVRVDGPADHDRLAAEIDRLLGSCSGDRLYVYIAARGCPSTPATYVAQPLILLPVADSGNNPAAEVGVAVEELAGCLAQVDFRAVVTIIDADRGAPGPAGPAPAVRSLERTAEPRRRAGTAMQFRLETFPPARIHGPAAPLKTGRLTAALLAALSVDGPGSGPVGDRAGGVRWSSLEPYLTSVLPGAPFVAGPNPSLVLAPLAAVAGRNGSRAAPVQGSAAYGDVHLHSPDPTAMLIIEDGSGARCAVGVGSIAGRLPVGAYTAVLADPCGRDPRVPLTVRPDSLTELTLGPRPRADGFRVTGHRSLTWSSPAAQLALATSGVWARGHRSFLLIGGAASVPSAELLLDGFPDRFASHGVLPADDGESGSTGWWVAAPVHGPWHTVGLGEHRITVPAAPDSVSSVAITAEATTVALFDTTHPEPAEIAAQDRVQEYLAVARLGAADLTSRSSVQTGQRWPWGASAAVRRLIDRTRSSPPAGGSRGGLAAAGDLPSMSVDGNGAAGTGQVPAPPYEFRADVPPGLLRLLVGSGPWAVWLDWPPADPSFGAAGLRSGLGAG